MTIWTFCHFPKRGTFCNCALFPRVDLGPSPNHKFTMEVDPSPGSSGGSTSGVVYTGGQSSLAVALHPLVIMNISEHWTRTKAQEGRPIQVYGAIIGKQTGRDIEVMNSFELDHATIEGDVVIDRDYYANKESQFKQVHACVEEFVSWRLVIKAELGKRLRVKNNVQ